MSELDRMKSLYDSVMKEFQQKITPIVRDRLKEIFDKYPDIEAISWTQYAPYFNDGEPCIFSVNEINILTEEIRAELKEDADDWFRSYTFDYASRDVYPLIVDFEADIQNVPADVMKAAFGDDSLIIATREEIKVEEYGDRHD